MVYPAESLLRSPDGKKAQNTYVKKCIVKAIKEQIVKLRTVRLWIGKAFKREKLVRHSFLTIYYQTSFYEPLLRFL